MWSIFKRRYLQNFQFRQRPEAVNLRNAAEYLMDEVHTLNFVELTTLERILAADLQIHPACFTEYMHILKEAI